MFLNHCNNLDLVFFLFVLAHSQETLVAHLTNFFLQFFLRLRQKVSSLRFRPMMQKKEKKKRKKNRKPKSQMNNQGEGFSLCPKIVSKFACWRALLPERVLTSCIRQPDGRSTVGKEGGVFVHCCTPFWSHVLQDHVVGQKDTAKSRLQNLFLKGFLAMLCLYILEPPTMVKSMQKF